MTEFFDDFPMLRLVAPFVELVAEIPWFRTLGEVLDQETYKRAEDYVNALGFPDATPALLGNWEDAAIAAENLDYNSPAWEAEEMERASLTGKLVEEVGEETLELVFAHVAQAVAEPVAYAVEDAAEHLQIRDQEFIQAATGAAAHACHLAALALMAGAEDDHPFLARFAVFEAGHWPVGLWGNSLNIF